MSWYCSGWNVWEEGTLRLSLGNCRAATGEEQQYRIASERKNRYRGPRFNKKSQKPFVS
ncbi:MAG: hypothetical protein PHD55_00255 [Methanoregula sp.]|nr:hypothetical protein [Methanoregula sp.]